jgi:hypothetical protein
MKFFNTIILLILLITTTTSYKAISEPEHHRSEETAAIDIEPSPRQTIIIEQTPPPTPIPTPTPIPIPQVIIIDSNSVSSYARSKITSTEFACLQHLWGSESGWQPGRINISSNAVGIPQSYPPTKLYPDFYSLPKVWRNGKYFLANPDYKREIDWGIIYIHNRYGNACTAYEFWLSKSPHWY